MMLDRILCGDYQKRLRQRMSLAVHGDLSFVHRFEQSGLSSWRSAIDFVGQDDVGKERAGAEFKFTRIGLIDAYAENVAWQKIGSELHTLKAAVERFRERLGQSGFAHAGNIFDQQVTTREQRDQGQLDGFFFAKNCPRDRALQLR